MTVCSNAASRAPTPGPFASLALSLPLLLLSLLLSSVDAAVGELEAAGYAGGGGRAGAASVASVTSRASFNHTPARGVIHSPPSNGLVDTILGAGGREGGSVMS